MGADVGHGPQLATLVGQHPPVVVGRVKEPVLDVAAADRVDVAQVASFDHVPGLQVEGIKTDVVVDARRQPFLPGLPGQLDEPGGFRRVHRQRFFTVYVLAGLEHPAGLLKVQTVGRRDVHHLHLVVGQQLLKADVPFWQPHLGRGLAGLFRGRAQNTRYPNPEPLQGLHVHRTDEPGTDDGRTNVIHSTPPFDLLIC